MWMHTKVDIVILCSPTYHLQNTWQEVMKYVNEAYTSPEEAFARVKEIVDNNGGQDKIFLILDDLSYERVLNTGNKGDLSELAYNAVWFNLTLCVIVHKLVNVSNALRDNIQHYIQFEVTNDEEKDAIYRTFPMVPNKKHFNEFYNQIITRPILEGSNYYPFIYVCYQKGRTIYNCFKEKINIVV